MKHAFIVALAAATLAALPGGPARGAAADAKEKAAAVKASLAASQALLKKYEWVETTTVLVKGEEKSRTVHRCYYGEDGKVQKVPVAAPPEEKPKRGIRGRIVEKKKEEMTAYMHEAVALVKTYVPPDAARLHAVQEAGGMTIQPMQGGAVVRLTFADYHRKGDSLGLDIDAKRNQLLAARVASHMASDDEPVTLAVEFGTIREAIVYASKTTLEAEGKKLTVVVENTGYRQAGGDR